MKVNLYLDTWRFLIGKGFKAPEEYSRVLTASSIKGVTPKKSSHAASHSTPLSINNQMKKRQKHKATHTTPQ